VEGLARAPSPVLFLRVDGSLFFGAVDHVRDTLHAYRASANPPRHVVLIGSGINFVDVAGADMLVQEARASANAGATLYLCNVKPVVQAVLARGGFLEQFGREHVFATEQEALDHFARLRGQERAVAEPTSP